MLINDVRYAVRQLRRSPSFTLTAVMTLALGIGASSAIFCVMDAHWLHPIRVPRVGELVRLFTTSPQDPDGTFTYPEYQEVAQRATALKSVVALGRRGSIMPRADGTTALLLTNVVSTNFFQALDVKPVLGRAFTPADASNLRTHPAILLGYGFWKREFAGDPNIVGRRITLQRGKDKRNVVDVWGVLPPEFREIDNGEDRDLWMAAETWAALVDEGEISASKFSWFNLLGRLAPGATVAHVNEQVSVLAKGWAAADPVRNHDRGARAVSDFRYRMANAGTSGLVLLAIVASVVLLAAVNVGHLLLARALARSPEVALRIALGARRAVLARQLLIENLLLCVVSLLAGIAIAAGIALVLPRLLVSEPAMLVQVGSSALFFPIDWRVFSFASVVTMGAMLLLAFVPLRQVSRPELLPAVQAGAATRTSDRAPMTRRAAIWLQIAISFALLVSTGTLVRSFLNTRQQSIGLTRDQVLLAWTQEPEAEMRDAIVARMKALPGVEDVGYAIRAPLSLSEGGISVHALLPSHPELRLPLEIKFNAVSREFLNVTGTRIVRGRSFSEGDTQDAPAAVIINQAMAQKYWPNEDAIGQVVKITGWSQGTGEARVIGVAENAPINRIGELPEPYLYVPYEQYAAHMSNMGEITFALHTAVNAMSMAQPVRQVLIHIHPLLDPMMETSLPELIRYSAGEYQMMAELVTALGIIGLALTIVGLYGYLAFRVTQRRREIGIRMALGASREATSLLVFRDTAGMALIGLAVGLLLAAGAARLESSLVFGVTPLNALSIAGALGVLAFAIVAASWLPARRAASIDPMQALRTE
jgi:predicted permease